MIHAINKTGREAYFSERVWELMPKDKNGWVKFSEQGEVLVPPQIVEFQQKKKQDVVDVVEESKPKMDTKTKPPVKRQTKRTKK